LLRQDRAFRGEELDAAIEERVADAAQTPAGSGDVGGGRLIRFDSLAQVARGHHAVALQLRDLSALIAADAIERRCLIGRDVDGDADPGIVPPVGWRHQFQSVAGTLRACARETTAVASAGIALRRTAAGIVHVRCAGSENNESEKRKCAFHANEATTSVGRR